MTFDQHNFLKYLKGNYPHLYDIETRISGIKEGTGFGEVSFSVRIINGMVERSSMLWSEDKKYRKRVDNVLE